MLQQRLKAKKLFSATLPHTWPKPVFPFKGSPGYLPVEAQPYVFISRRTKNGKRGRAKVVPQMLFPIQANRQPVPKHEVLEDDYRAFHTVVVNQLALARFATKQDGPINLMDFQSCVPLNSAIRLGRIGEVKDQLPQQIAYNPGCHPPPGYMYQRYKDSRTAANQRRPVGHAKLSCPPVVIIKDPFQNMVRLCTPHYCNNIKHYDSAVIGRAQTTEIRIYNETDAVSSLAVDANFELPLSKRARPGGPKVKPAP
ncbi:hypothetical protein EGW08_006244 [Elysia chlorotica]|uniref:Uncharacterized protein n=1 Tax=Elysia chlorotica TaxID=188477 RepID=A0A3S1BDQ4_ELYCH|nr:hypothetical protein EGW08_006244 [Elysia chlorotica]